MIYERKSWFKCFLEGFVCVFDLFGVLGKEDYDLDNGFEKDAEAIASDWQAVGDDIRLVMKLYS